MSEVGATVMLTGVLEVEGMVVACEVVVGWLVICCVEFWAIVVVAAVVGDVDVLLWTPDPPLPLIPPPPP